MSQLSLLDHEPASGEALKNEGVAQVIKHNADWMDSAIAAMSAYVRLHTGAFTSADWRAWVRLNPTYHDLMPPPHPNAIGGLFNTAAHRGLIVATGQFVKSTTPSAHGRIVQLWRAA